MEEIRTDTGGVKPIPIQGRLGIELERLKGMTDEERKIRAQWVRDQQLAPNEPVYVPEIEKELTNPIRRACRYPLDKLFDPIRPKFVCTIFEPYTPIKLGYLSTIRVVKLFDNYFIYYVILYFSFFYIQANLYRITVY